MYPHDDYAFGGSIGSWLKNKFSSAGDYLNQHKGKIAGAAGAATLAGLGAYGAHRANQARNGMQEQYPRDMFPPEYSHPEFNRNVQRPVMFEAPPLHKAPAYGLDRWEHQHNLQPYGAQPMLHPDQVKINRQNSAQGPAGGFGVMLHGNANNYHDDDFAQGGHVSNLRNMAERVQHAGTHGDTILAHINKDEYEMLKHNGMTINPETGLPSFGFFGSMKRSLFGGHKPDASGHRKHGILTSIVRPVLPIAGAVAGTLLTGGVGGAVAGGALGNIAKNRGKKPLKSALGGAGIGLLTNVGMGILGKGIGGNLGSKMSAGALDLGKMFGGSNIASKSAPALMAKKALTREVKPQQMVEQPEEQGGLSGFFSGLGGKAMNAIAENPLQTALLATAIGGTLGRKEKPGQESMNTQDYLRSQGMSPEDREYYHGNARRAKPLAVHEQHYAHQEEYDPYKPYYVRPYFKEANPATQYYAKGGRVQHYEKYHPGIGSIDGEDGGQQDNVKTELPNGAFVWDATTTSLLGDGNSRNGLRKIQQFEDKFLKSGVTRDLSHSHNTRYNEGGSIKANVSDGEHITPPEVVSAIGGGSNKKGAQAIDVIRKNIRKQKGVKTFLPPKSKPIEHYMGRRK